MSDKEKTDKTALTADTVLDELRRIAEANPDTAAARCAISFGMLREILERVTDGSTLREDILKILDKYKEDYPHGDGLPAADLWRSIRGRHPATPLGEIEDLLTSMMQEREIYTRRNGFTTYLPGQDPELEAAEFEDAKEDAETNEK